MKVIISSYFEGKESQINTTVPDFKGTISDGYNLCNNISTSVSPIYTFAWRETKLFTRQIKVQIGKSTLIIFFIKEKMPTLAGNKHFSVHLLLHGPRLFHLLTEKVKIRSIAIGHQSGYSDADTINNNKNKGEREFHKRKLLKYIREVIYSTEEKVYKC